MSTACRLARPPAALISPATFSPAAASRSRMPTAQPSSASRRAMAALTPWAPQVTMRGRSSSPPLSTPHSSLLRPPLLVFRSTRQHPGGFIGDHDLVVLVLDVDLGDDDAAIAFRRRAHRDDLDLAV